MFKSNKKIRKYRKMCREDFILLQSGDEGLKALILSFIISQNDQSHFKILAEDFQKNATRFAKCV